ncbi:MAG TPA: T9SS type A sorting domain-containing protein [Bacteroidia bacterium]|jgi:poly(3-hydroxybutyrate) depolymerase
MKKIYLSVLSGVLMLGAAADASAQCFGGRYHNYVFPTHTLTSNVQYGSNVKHNNTNFNLMLDIYEPQGDAAQNRALVIVAHGGSFVGGSKTGSDVVQLCKDLAKLGYVAASIEYRTGMTHFPVGGPPDSTDAGAAVMRAVHDGRAAVRFFRKNHAVGGNTYRIDPNNIYFAGVSAGGFIALHIAYMDQLSEFPAYVDTTGTGTNPQHGLHGGIEGLSGNPGYSSDVKGVINLCGALGDTAWMQPGDEPVLNMHGNNDNTVPYGSEVIYLLGTYPLLVVDGSESIAMRADNIGLSHCFKTYYNQDHVPHVGTSANNLAQYDTTIVYMRNFLEYYTCGTPSLVCSYNGPIQMIPLGVEQAETTEQFSVFPNPAESTFTLDLSAFSGKNVRMDIFDVLGKNVKSMTSINQDRITLSRDGLSNGMYMIRITTEEKQFSRKISLK